MHGTTQRPAHLSKRYRRQRERNKLLRCKAPERAHQSQRIARERSAQSMSGATDAGALLIPAERLARNGRPPALQANIELWALPSGVKEGEFSPTRDQGIWRTRLEQVPGMEEQLIELRLRLLVTRCSFDQLRDIPSNRRTSEPAAKSEPHPNAAYLGDRIEGPTRDQGKVKLGEGLNPPTETARRLADTLGDRLELAARCREKGEHAIGLAEAESRGNNGQRRGALTCRHDAQGSIALSPRRDQTRRAKGKGGA